MLNKTYRERKSNVILLQSFRVYLKRKRKPVLRMPF